MNSPTTRISYVLLAIALVPTMAFAAVNVERINLDPNGNEEIPGLAPGCDPAIACIQGSSGSQLSADGRYVVWSSFGINLVSDDTNEDSDVFLHDRDTGETVRVSVAPDGSQLPLNSAHPNISADARYISFQSDSNGVVADDNNDSPDYFVHDRLTGENVRVTVDNSFLQGVHVLSGDGRHVAYEVREGLVPEDTNEGNDIYVYDLDTGITEWVSVATGGVDVASRDRLGVGGISTDGQIIIFASDGAFVAEDTNDTVDCFLRERMTGETTRVSVTSAGNEAPDRTFCVAMSSDGRYILLQSGSPDLVPNDTNDAEDMFIHDRVSGVTEIISIASDGTQSNQQARNNARVSDDGRFVVFQSSADTLIPGDMLGTDFDDTFLRDRVTGKTYQVSVTQDGWPADAGGGGPSISADGKYIAFDSSATNIVPNDTNCIGDIFVVEVASIINAAPPVPNGDTPFALNDRVDVTLGSSVTVDVLANDIGLSDVPITVEIACAPLIGTATVNADNTITYSVPENDDNVALPLRYRITDADRDQFSAELSFAAQLPEPPPPPPPPPPNVAPSGGSGAFGPFLLLMSLSLLLLRYSVSIRIDKQRRTRRDLYSRPPGY